MLPDPAQANAMRAPSPSDVRTMLSDICTNSGADVSFDKLNFNINGSDDAVKAAMMVIHQIPFVKRAQYQMRVKIELANEHKEFVSGKKNGKINKIMGQSELLLTYFLWMRLNHVLQATYKSSSMASTNITFISTYVAPSMRLRRMASISLNRKCLRPSRFMFRISTTSVSSALVVNTFNVS